MILKDGEAGVVDAPVTLTGRCRKSGVVDCGSEYLMGKFRQGAWEDTPPSVEKPVWLEPRRFTLTGVKVKGRVEVTGTMEQIAAEVTLPQFRAAMTEEDRDRVQKWAADVVGEVDMKADERLTNLVTVLVKKLHFIMISAEVGGGMREFHESDASFPSFSVMANACNIDRMRTHVEKALPQIAANALAEN